MQTDIAIIGAGPVGIFAAFQAGMLGMRAYIIDALDFPGGQCSTLYPEKPIYDIPGHPAISAQDLVDRLLQQASVFSPIYLMSRQVNALKEENNKFILQTSKNDIIEAKAVLIAAGAGAFAPNKPPLVDIELYENSSIFYQISNIQQFAGKKITIAGGGDSAVDWAISLSAISDVTIVHRREKFRAAPASIQMLNSLAEQGKIKLVTNFQLHQLIGANNMLKEIVVTDLDGNKKLIEAEILLPFFGLLQSLGPLLNFGLGIKNHHIIVSHPYFETNIKGIYAVGDVATYDGKLKLILTGFAEVSSALHHSYSRVFDGQALHFEHSTSKNIKTV